MYVWHMKNMVDKSVDYFEIKLRLSVTEDKH